MTELNYIEPSVFPVRGQVNYVPATYYQMRGGGTRQHRGHDIVARRGTLVVAAAPGVVARVYRRSEAEGNGVTIVDSKGARHSYFHFQEQPNLYEGQEIRAGQMLGRVGSTGRADGPHLHYQIEKSGRRYNASDKLIELLSEARLAGQIPEERYLPGRTV